jgi:hypothetical protein
MPIDLVLKQRAIEYYVKHGILTDACYEYFREENIDLNNVHKPFPFYKLPHPASVQALDITLEQIESLPTEDQTIIFTYGSKTTEGVGAGFCALKNKQIIKKAKFKLASYCTIFQVNLFVVLQSLIFINHKFKYSSRVLIITESITTLKSLKDTKSVTQLVQQIFKESVIIQERGIRLSFTWICSYNENQWRDLAKSLAKAGATAHRSIDYDIIPMSYIKRIIYKKNLELWNTRWLNTPNGATTKKYFPTVFDRQKVNKTFDANYYVTQFLTNHGSFNAYLHRFTIRDDQSCTHCHALIANAEHIIYDCPEYQQLRNKLIVSLEVESVNWPCIQRLFISSKAFEYFKNFCISIFNINN